MQITMNLIFFIFKLNAFNISDVFESNLKIQLLANSTKENSIGPPTLTRVALLIVYMTFYDKKVQASQLYVIITRKSACLLDVCRFWHKYFILDVVSLLPDKIYFFLCWFLERLGTTKLYKPKCSFLWLKIYLKTI